jgi:hypothetical protein
VAPERWMHTFAAKCPARTASARSLPATSWLRNPAHNMHKPPQTRLANPKTASCPAASSL